MKVLIIEDSDYKIDHIREVIGQVLPETELFIARAFKSGVALALEHRPDLLLLDMSLPTFEVGRREAGGRTRPFGGREVLRELDAIGVMTRVIVVTQFDQFGEGKRSVLREQLMEELKQEFPEMIVAGVYYNGADSEWRDALTTILRNLRA